MEFGVLGMIKITLLEVKLQNFANIAQRGRKVLPVPSCNTKEFNKIKVTPIILERSAAHHLNE